MDFKMFIRTNIKYLFAVFSLLSTSVAARDCHVCIDGSGYKKVQMLETKHISGQLGIDKTVNVFYFHYEDEKGNDYTASFDLNNVRLKLIPGINFSFARTVDQNTRELYMGGVTGLFKYNPGRNKTEQIGLTDKTILDLQYKNKILYTIFNTKGMFVYEKKQSKSLTQLSNYTIDFFVIDKREDIYFLSDGKVYRLKKGAKWVTLFSDDVYILAVDKLDNIFLVHPMSRGIYTLDYNTDELLLIGAFSNGLPTKIVFDSRNNMIYLDAKRNKLYYLSPNYGKCKISRNSRRNKKRMKYSTVVDKGREQGFFVEEIK